MSIELPTLPHQFTRDERHQAHEARERILTTRIAELDGERDALRRLAMCAYQLAGAHDAPVTWLDALSAASVGEPFSTDGLLPYCGNTLDQIGALRAEAERLRETWTDESGNVWSPPTAFAYGKACEALNAAKAENERLREVASKARMRKRKMSLRLDRAVDKLNERTEERDRLRADAERHSARVDELRSGLAGTLGWMEQLRLSGDAGFWDWRAGDQYSSGFDALWGAFTAIDAARGGA